VHDEADVEHEGGVPKHLESVYQSQAAKQKRGRRKFLIGCSIIILVIVLAAGRYILLHHKTKKPTKQTTTNQQNLPQPAADTNSGTSDYTAPADGLNLGFSYPSSWTASPASGQTSDTITVTSPLVSLPDAATGANVTGKVVILIRGDTS